MYMNERWIWFDLDDTLHDFVGTAKIATPKVLNLLAQKSGLPLDTIQTNYKTALKSHNAVEFTDGRASHEYRAERFLAALGHKKAPDKKTSSLIEEALHVYEETYIGNLSLKPHTIETLSALKEHRISLAIITDAPEDAQGRVIEKLGIGSFFKTVLTSGGMRVSKKKGLFEKALDHMKTTPDHVVMIGNSLPSDIFPALALGIDAIWYNDIGAKNESSCRVIQSHTELCKELKLPPQPAIRGAQRRPFDPKI